MKKWLWLLIPGLLLTGALLMAGCFASPTNPHEGAFGSGGSHGTVPTAVPTARPTVAPTATPTTSTYGSISGNITGTTSGTITITATNTNLVDVYNTTHSGVGTYTINNVVDGSYSVTASDTTSHAGAYIGLVLISGHNNASGININMY